jgi:enoyl-CoA hydratase/carnithine racemase
MTGERIGPDEALRIGLVQEVVGSVDEGLNRAKTMADLASKNSPTAVAAFKRGALAAVGLAADSRQEIEALAYEHCLDTGEAQIGRENFKAIRTGEKVSWGPLQEFKP